MNIVLALKDHQASFHARQAGVHTALFWIRIVTYREALTMSGALDVLQMKGEDVLKFLAAGTHLGGTNLDFQMEQHVYKRKSDGIYIINLKRTWEKLLLAARAMVAIENPAGVSVVSSRNTGQRTGLKFAAVTGATSVAGRFTPGTFTNQTQAAFREPGLPVVTGPGLTTCLSQGPLTLTCLPLLCVTQAPLWYVDIASHATTRELTRGVCCGGCSPGKFCAYVVPSPVNAPGRSCLTSTSAETLKRLKRTSRQQLRRLWPRRDFRVNGPLQLLSSLLLSRRWRTGPKACRCPRACSAVPR